MMKPLLVCHGSLMPNLPHTQDLVEAAPPSSKYAVDQRVLAPFGWCCDFCSDAKTDEPCVDLLTDATRRFVSRRLEAAIDELRRLDPGRRTPAIAAAIVGLKEIRDELEF